MPEYLAPGVFVEETSFRQKTIEGVGTSTAGFVGPTRFGPTSGVPELLTSFREFERIYAGLDQLDIAGTPVHNFVAHGVRAFFENGGRRCYVTRARHSGLADGAGTATGEVAAGTRRLRLRARHPGRAGNFQVTFTLRMGLNVLDRRAGHPTRLRGAQEYQVVWLDRVNDSGTVRTGQLAFLHDTFDADANLWTYDLRTSAATPGADGVRGFGPVTRLSAETTDVRLVVVDVEVGPLGDFLDAQRWTGLGMHSEDRNSLQEVFGPQDRASRSTELYVPLVVSTEGLEDGADVAALLLEASGAAAGLTGTGAQITVLGAVGGTVALRVGGAAPVDVPFDATAPQVAAALGGGATVTGPGGGPWVVALRTGDAVTADGGALVGAGSVRVREGTRWVVEPDGNAFRLVVAARTTQELAADASADAVDDALEEILGPGAVRVEALTGPARYVITLLGGHEQPLVATPAGVAVTPTDPVTVVQVDADAGTFVLVGPAAASGTIDATAADEIAQGLQQAFDLPDPPARTGGEFVVVLPATSVGALTVESSTVTASPGTATVEVTTVVSPLARSGGAASVAARLAGGEDGSWPDPDGYAGGAGLRKSGLEALSDLPDVSIVAAPGATYDAETDAAQVRGRVGHVITHCEDMRYRIAVVDTPPALLPTQVVTFRGEFDSTHAALYYPWVTVFDAVTRREVALPPSGFVAGIYARNDVQRGVHKAPANETVAMSVGFELAVNTAQQELLNPLGVNCLRHLDQRGRRVWGARTMTSDPEWKYVNLRRYFAFLEASIDRGTQWAVFEPNGSRLWDNVRRTVEDFLLNEFASGHLLGATTEEAFFVRCDRSTMTQNDLDNGRLICLIGVAPLRPAEFVVFRIGQKTLELVG